MKPCHSHKSATALWIHVAGQYLGLKHNLGQLLPLFGGEARLLELLEAVGKPLPLLQAAQLAGLHRHLATVGAFKVGLNLLHRSLGFPQVPQTCRRTRGLAVLSRCCEVKSAFLPC